MGGGSGGGVRLREWVQSDGRCGARRRDSSSGVPGDGLTTAPDLHAPSCVHSLAHLPAHSLAPILAERVLPPHSGLERFANAPSCATSG